MKIWSIVLGEVANRQTNAAWVKRKPSAYYNVAQNVTNNVLEHTDQLA